VGPGALVGLVIRVGVVLCVAVAIGRAVKFDDTLGVYDLRADRNAAATFADRTYPKWLTTSREVMETARLTIPEGDSYRVLIGGRAGRGDARAGRDFLVWLLLPRRHTDSESAQWVFCYSCDVEALGGRFEVLARSGQLSFGRVVR
jgi:hypothetical protein